MAKGRFKKRRYPAASLTDDLVIEILSRLPIKSVCRCKCVSRTWRNLISHPDHRSKLPQTLAGFFYRSTNGERFPVSALHFPGKGRPLIFPSCDFLPRYQLIIPLDCCNGLLLCRYWSAQDDFHYVVCNPATKKWVALPDSSQAGKVCIARLGFDPAVSSHFHVFEFLKDEDVAPFVAGVEVYSSKTGGWVHKENGWNDRIRVVGSWSATDFLNGCLHFVTLERNAAAVDAALERTVAAVDTEGKTWRSITVPDGPGHFGFVQQSQGCLHYASFERHDARVRLVIYVLENYDSQEWILKHSAEPSNVFGGRSVNLVDFVWVAIHPECNLIFFTVGWDKTLMSYDMDRQQAQVIRNLGHESTPPYLPYVPLYSELQALHM